jgi:hypothetical protein
VFAEELRRGPRQRVGVAAELRLERLQARTELRLRDAVAVGLERERQDDQTDQRDEGEDREREAGHVPVDPPQRSGEGRRDDREERRVLVAGVPRGDVRLVLARDVELLGDRVAAEELAAGAGHPEAEDLGEEGAAAVIARDDHRLLRERRQRSG